MIQIVRVFDDLPDGFDALLAEAQAEGVRNMTLLGEQWGHDPELALFAAFMDGELAGVGGVSPEPEIPPRGCAGCMCGRRSGAQAWGERLQAR